VLEQYESTQVAEEKLQWQSLVNIVKEFVFHTIGVLSVMYYVLFYTIRTMQYVFS